MSACPAACPEIVGGIWWESPSDPLVGIWGQNPQNLNIFA